MEEQGTFIFLNDHRNRLIAIAPEFIHIIQPLTNREQCFIFFSGENMPRLFNHSVYEVIEALDTFYNAN